jgi:hypothetical protein
VFYGFAAQVGNAFLLSAIPDGSRMRTHALVRYNVNANGKVTVRFVKARGEDC